jgi:hypothetical protein
MTKDNSQSDDAFDQQPQDHESHAGLWVIIGVGLIGLALIAILGFWFVTEQKIRFVTEFSLTTMLATLVAVQAYIYRRQWAVMERQGNAMQDTLVETRKLIAVGEQQADTSKAAVLMAERSAIAAEENLKSAKDAFYASERAYVTIPEAASQTTGAEVVILLTVENIGKTPAYRVRISASMNVVAEPPIIDDSSPTWENIGLIGQGSYVKKRFATKQGPLEKGLEQVQRNERKLCCWGLLEYFDISNECRRTKFCFQLNPFLASSAPYGDQNEAD